ncbi:MAG TPA: phage tail protein [Polyangium sp.]|nr:phage tail protein [Polyangium sp.]
MATAAKDIKTNYPLPAYNYRVEIDGTSYAFSEVSGLSIQIEITTYKQSQTENGMAGPTVMHMPAQKQPATISLKRGIINNSDIRYLYEWISATQINVIDKKDIFVRLLDEAGAPVLSWKVRNAFPKQLDAPTFTANSNEVAIESMTLQADGVELAK